MPCTDWPRSRSPCSCSPTPHGSTPTTSATPPACRPDCSSIGLPITFALGFGLAAALFTDMPWELAALLGAALAPTDAALSASVVSDESLPQSIRRALNVESGLNDGIATPVVTSLIAASATVIGVGVIDDTASGHGVSALIDLVGGVTVGVVAGYVGGRALSSARAAGLGHLGRRTHRRADARRRGIPRGRGNRGELLRRRVRGRHRVPRRHRRGRQGGDRAPRIDRPGTRLGRVVRLRRTVACSRASRSSTGASRSTPYSA